MTQDMILSEEQIDARARVQTELIVIHDIYSSEDMIDNFMNHFDKDSNKNLRENIADYVEAWELTHTDNNKQAGYWIHQGYKPWKARHLAGISNNFVGLQDDEVLEIFDGES